jgi:hypothetical protein
MNTSNDGTLARTFLDVAVIHVERRHARLVPADHPFEIFVAVEQIERQLILPRLPAIQLRARLFYTQTKRDQIVRKAPRPFVQLAERDSSIAKHDRFFVRKSRRDGFVDCAEIEHLIDCLPQGKAMLPAVGSQVNRSAGAVPAASLRCAHRPKAHTPWN